MDPLQSFPPEVWEIITSELDCYSLVNLWRTSKSAVSLLSNGGVTSLSLLLGIQQVTDFWSPLTFSARMQKLRHLCLRSVGVGYYTETPTPPNFDFPSTLVSLVLESVYIPQEYLEPLLPHGLTALSIPETDYVLENCISFLGATNVTSLTYTASAGQADWEGIGDVRFPDQLTNLSMYTTPDAERLFLPNGLLAFSCDIIGNRRRTFYDDDDVPVDIINALISRLPTGLTRLNLPNTIFFEQVAHLPSLRFIQTPGPLINSIEWLLAFPNKITLQPLSQPTETVVRLVRGLPLPDGHANLKTALSSELLQFIPKDVTSLTASALGKSHIGGDADFRFFVAEALSNKPVPAWDASLLPPTLTLGSLSKKDLKLLPNSITHLEVSEFQVNQNFRTAADPRMAFGSPAGGIGEEESRWPGKLTRLTLSDLKLDDFAITWIPEGLTELSVSECLVDINDDKLNQLLSFESNVCPFVTDDDIPLLPRNMHTLHLAYCPQVTPIGLSNLPPALTSLIIGWKNETLFSESLEHLPRSLTFLDVQDTIEIDPSELEALPPTLNTLRWRKCQNFSVRHAASLPSSLTELKLTEIRRLSGMVYPALPRTLRSLHITCVENTEFSFFADLPPSLTELDISSLKSIGTFAVEILLRLSHLKTLSIPREAMTSMKASLLLSRVPVLNLTGQKPAHRFQTLGISKIEYNLATIEARARAGTLKGKFAIPCDFGRWPPDLDL